MSLCINISVYVQFFIFVKYHSNLVIIQQSHNDKDMFLATQAPLPNTIGDIWRMVYDYKCNTIVMLNPLDTSDKVGKIIYVTD